MTHLHTDAQLSLAAWGTANEAEKWLTVHLREGDHGGERWHNTGTVVSQTGYLSEAGGWHRYWHTQHDVKQETRNNQPDPGPTLKPEPVCECGTPGTPDYDGPSAVCDVHGLPSAAYEQGLRDGAMQEQWRPAFERIIAEGAAGEIPAWWLHPELMAGLYDTGHFPWAISDTPVDVEATKAAFMAAYKRGQAMTDLVEKARALGVGVLIFPPS